jgi:hypothetical protein
VPSRHERYLWAARRAFATVPFYREQCARGGGLLIEPDPTRTGDLPDPPHTLCPFARPWSAADEPPLWTPDPRALARVLRLSGCGARIGVLEVRDAVLDHGRLPGLRRRGHRVLLTADAVVASPWRRADINAVALSVLSASGGAWVVGTPEELASLPSAAGIPLIPVARLPVRAASLPVSVGTPALLHDPVLGYVGALVPECGEFHLDHPRVYPRERGGLLTLSLPRSRRPTLLAIACAGAETVRAAECDSHRTPVLRPR